MGEFEIYQTLPRASESRWFYLNEIILFEHTEELATNFYVANSSPDDASLNPGRGQLPLRKHGGSMEYK